MSKHHVSITINGEPADVPLETQQTLLDALRTNSSSRAAKEGCSSGDCGACSVIVDGPAGLRLPDARGGGEGRTIETIEGLAQGDHLHPTPETFSRGSGAPMWFLHTGPPGGGEGPAWIAIQLRRKRRPVTGWQATSAVARGTIRSSAPCSQRPPNCGRERGAHDSAL